MLTLFDTLAVIVFFLFVISWIFLVYATVGARRANKLWKVWKNV